MKSNQDGKKWKVRDAVEVLGLLGVMFAGWALGFAAVVSALAVDFLSGVIPRNELDTAFVLFMAVTIPVFLLLSLLLGVRLTRMVMSLEPDQPRDSNGRFTKVKKNEKAVDYWFRLSKAAVDEAFKDGDE